MTLTIHVTKDMWVTVKNWSTEAGFALKGSQLIPPISIFFPYCLFEKLLLEYIVMNGGLSFSRIPCNTLLVNQPCIRMIPGWRTQKRPQNEYNNKDRGSGPPLERQPESVVGRQSTHRSARESAFAIWRSWITRRVTSFSPVLNLMTVDWRFETYGRW